MILHVYATTNRIVVVVVLCMYFVFDDYVFSACSLHSFGLPSCRNCELVSTSSPSHQQHFGPRGQTTTTTTTNVTTSSLGLLQLLQERGISAAPYPHHHHHLHHSHNTTPSPSTAKDKGGGSLLEKEGRRNIFSLNLVEKLQGLGLHRVAAWGMTDRSGREKQSDHHFLLSHSL